MHARNWEFYSARCRTSLNATRPSPRGTPGPAYTKRLLSLPVSRKRLLIAPRPSNAVARLLACACARIQFRDDVGPASAYSLLLAENIPDLTGKIAVDLGTDFEMECCTDFRLNSTFEAISTRSFPSSYPNYSPGL